MESSVDKFFRFVMAYFKAWLYIFALFVVALLASYLRSVLA